MHRLRSWLKAANAEMVIGRIHALLFVSALVVLGAGILGFVLASGGSDDEAPVVQATPTVSVAEGTASGEAPLSESYRMIIESLGVNAPISTYGLDENAIPIVPTGPDAAEVIAWYDFSAKPGTGSNAVFAGHVTWNGDAVFRRLDTLKAGDIVRLRDEKGAEIVYRVFSNFFVDPNDPESVKVMYPTATDQATIITCGGDFFDTGDPVAGGDYTERVIVKAELVSVTPVA
jgi:LPXTG-site transpeptidase (sortase) family protein